MSSTQLNWLAYYQLPSSVPKFALIKLSLGRANRKQFVFGGTWVGISPQQQSKHTHTHKSAVARGHFPYKLIIMKKKKKKVKVGGMKKERNTLQIDQTRSEGWVNRKERRLRTVYRSWSSGGNQNHRWKRGWGLLFHCHQWTTKREREVHLPPNKYKVRSLGISTLSLYCYYWLSSPFTGKITKGNSSIRQRREQEDKAKSFDRFERERRRKNKGGGDRR